MPQYKIDFHAHCDCDPIDILTYTPFDLVDRALEYGIQALAITPHMLPFRNVEVMDYAKKRGLLLIPGVEKLVEGKEVLLLNVTPEEIPSPCTFEDLKKLRRIKGDSLFIMAPHPFYPHHKCVGTHLDLYKDLFDAVEYSHFHFFGWNPNQKAVEWAKANSKPILANSDAHRVQMVGTNYTLVEADELSIPSIFKAIRTKPTIVHAPALHLEHLILFCTSVIFVQEVAHRLFPKIKPSLEN